MLSDLDGGFYDSVTGIYTDTGTTAEVTVALDGLVFTPTAHQVAPGQTVTTGFTIDDTDTAGNEVSDDATTVVTTASDVPPTISGTVAGQAVTDNAVIQPFLKVTISDPNIEQTDTVTVTLSAAANGTLENLSDFDYNRTTGVVTFIGNVSQVNEALDGVVFVPTAHQVAPGQTVTTGFTIGDTDTAGFTTSDDTTTVVTTAVGPRTLSWNGGQDGVSFSAAGNWSDLTDDLNQALEGPDSLDTVEFDSGSGFILGGGTVSAVDVGQTTSGVLELNDDSTIVTGILDSGVAANGIGQIGLTGFDTELTVTGSATVGDDGTGVLSVLGGATFAADGLTIGSQSNSSGAVVVSGSRSVINIAGSLNVGTALGTGDLTIGPGAVVNALVVNQQGQVVLENGELDPTVDWIAQGITTRGSGTIAADIILDEGVIQAGLANASENTLIVQGTVVDGQSLTINGTVEPAAVGQLRIGSGATMELTGPVLNVASLTFTDEVTPANTYAVTNSVVDVGFADGTGVLQLDDVAGFAATITAFSIGDQFVITGGTLGALGTIGDGDTLTVADGGANGGAGGLDRIFFNQPIQANSFKIVNGNTIEALACFAEGTRIETETDLVAVEKLGVGDRVITNDGTPEPIVWIGQRTVNCERHPSPETVWPVRIARGAFGENVPARDLYLSPDHAVFVNGVLVPVKLLVDGTGIAPEKRSKVMYYHVELPRHAVILAEGLTVESYLDLGGRANFANDGETIRLFPDFAAHFTSETAPAWETHGVAPLVMVGEAVERARRLVASRAARRPHRSRAGSASGGHQPSTRFE
jgi:T5SS/PEP-CTERM-associated repeat protein